MAVGSSCVRHGSPLRGRRLRLGATLRLWPPRLPVPLGCCARSHCLGPHHYYSQRHRFQFVGGIRLALAGVALAPLVRLCWPSNTRYPQLPNHQYRHTTALTPTDLLASLRYGLCYNLPMDGKCRWRMPMLPFAQGPTFSFLVSLEPLVAPSACDRAASRPGQCRFFLTAWRIPGIHSTRLKFVLFHSVSTIGSYSGTSCSPCSSSSVGPQAGACAPTGS